MTADIDVIVPVLQRPQRARPFMDSLRATTGRASVLAVYSSWDQRTGRAWRRAGADVLEVAAQPGSFAQKVNAGYRARAASEFTAGPPPPWVLLVGDDVRFHPGWADAALEVAEATGADVVSTADRPGGDGTAGVHPLVRRAYVDERGAAWGDGPGVVCHEGYRHNYVDAELAAVAKERGVWAPAPGAVIEHLHHIFGTAPVDRTYEVGTASLEQDRALFWARVAEHAEDPSRVG